MIHKEKAKDDRLIYLLNATKKQPIQVRYHSLKLKIKKIFNLKMSSFGKPKDFFM